MSYTAGSVKAFSCPQCGGIVAIHAVGISITAVCQYCGGLIDVANENLKIIHKSAINIHPITLEIGSRATLFEVEWEVIGYMEREINNAYGRFSWEEYLLFNPWQGFRFLVCSDDHWTFVKTLRQEINDQGRIKVYAGKDYKIFAEETAKVTYVLGEFYWRVKVGEQTKVTDFIAPPYILSREENEDEVIWSHGVYLEPEIIKQAFNLSFLPDREGIAPNQPSPVAQHVSGIKVLAVVFFAALCLVQLFGVGGMAENKTVFSQQIHATPEKKDQVVLSEPIELGGKTSNVEITVSSGVNNNWLELNSVLTNDATQQSFEINQVVEYYSGYDDEGSWSEGRQQSETMIAAVPAGQYHLLLTPDAGVYAQGQPVDFAVTIKRDVPTSSNFWIALLALLVYPAIILYRHSSFEKRRWADSDYTP